VHFAAALRTMLPFPLAALSGHASLANPLLAPHDTLTASVSAGQGAAHGTFRVSFGAAHPAAGGVLAPTPDALGMITPVPFFVAGTAGWVRVVPEDGRWAVTIASVPGAVGFAGADELSERTETFQGVGVREEIRSWLRALAGDDDGLNLGEPGNALKDVVIIEAALKSKGQEVDLVKLAASGEV
jgi:hypothetical protein